MNRGNIHSPSVAEECLDKLEGKQPSGGEGVREGGREGGKRDVHSPFGIVWVEKRRRGSNRSGKRAGVSISPKLSRVNGGRCRGRGGGRRREMNV